MTVREWPVNIGHWTGRYHILRLPVGFRPQCQEMDHRACDQDILRPDEIVACKNQEEEQWLNDRDFA